MLPDSLTAAHPILSGIYYGTLAVCVGAWLATAVRRTWSRWGRLVLVAGVVAHLVGTVGRGVAIEFFPLTNKLESFSASSPGWG